MGLSTSSKRPLWFTCLILTSCLQHGPSATVSSDPDLSILARSRQDLPDEDALYQKALVITDRSVVYLSDHAAPAGAWDFNTVIDSLARATGRSGEKLMNDWIHEWETQRNPELGNRYPPRDGRVVQELRKVRNSSPGTGNKFQLIGITNRIDLDNPEARLIYELQTDDNRTAMPFTLILEYGLVPRDSARPSGQVLADWANGWLELPELSDPAYPDQLKALSDRFLKPSHLLRVRTNEQLGGGAWEMRQFNDQLTLEQLPGTPDEKFKYIDDNFPELDKYLQFRKSDIERGKPIFDDDEGSEMLGYWTVDDPRWANLQVPESRPYYLFRFNTCTGCHLEEAEDDANRHLQSKPVYPGGPLATVLSAFLSGNFAPTFIPPDCEPAWCSAGSPNAWNEKRRRLAKLTCLASAVINCNSGLSTEESLMPGSSYRYH